MIQWGLHHSIFIKLDSQSESAAKVFRVLIPPDRKFWALSVGRRGLAFTFSLSPSGGWEGAVPNPEPGLAGTCRLQVWGCLAP